MGRWLIERHPEMPLGDWRRSAFLVLFGIMHVIYGWSFLALGPTETQTDALVIPLRLAELAGVGTGSAFAIAGWLWIADGVLASVGGLVPPGRDRWGFVILTSLQAGWATAFLLSWLLAGNARGLASAAFFFAFMFAALLMSGCVSADRVQHEGRQLALLPPASDGEGG